VNATTWRYIPNVNGVIDSQFAKMGKTNVTVQGPAVAAPRLNPTYSVLTNTAGYPGNNLSSDPQFLDMYCNGSRAAPEFSSVINPPSPKNLQVAATVDEGNNYVTLRYGPLYLSKPDTAGITWTAFGDLHIAGNSPAKDSGTPISGIDHDVDGDRRGPGATGPNGAYDRGADEIKVPAPIVSLSPSSLAFGGQLIGTSSAAMTVTVSNTGDAPLVFNAATPAATAGVSISGNFAVAGGTTCVSGATVAAGASCSINLNFSPTAPAGSKSGTLTLRDNAGGGSQTVSLTGTATQPTVGFTAATLGALSTSFGGQRQLAFGDLTGTQTSIVTLTASNGSVTFGIALVSNSTGTSFTKGAADTCSGKTIAAGGTCTITISFAAPFATSSRVGTLSVPDNASGSPQTLRLTGS
jgi:hypothetical protein